ncbi:MAG TPA: acyl-CoA dehydrogenase [Kofleriaceae bacterium]|nr:acyl-CoA dehydrogenase [Kofleriaceae bacterium]
MTPRTSQLDDPQLRAFLPLLYVAWADLELEPGELRALQQRIAAQPWLRPAAKLALESWLDPGAPPTARELGELHALVERVADTTSPRARRSLIALADSIALDAESREAARELAVQLGIPDDHDDAAAEPEAHEHPELEALGELFDGPDADVRRRIRDFLRAGRYRAYGLPTEVMRAKVRGWLGELAATRIGELAYPGITSPTPDLRAFMTAFEELAIGDGSLLVKLGVQVGLYGGAIYALGTERHHARLAAIARCEELGCFAMSEVGHGSNVADLETTARYDHATRELVIHTPAESARKEWIGGAAHDARWAVVFAQLVVPAEHGEQSHGVHAVLVPIRDAAGDPMPGVRIGDCGHKLGLNGVDNGRLWFEHVRVPVDHLLDRFATIDEHGVYASPIASPSKRFFVMLGTLVGGRITVGSAGVSAARVGLAIAIRYALARRQFGDPPERTLLEYPSHRRRLLPHLATNVVLRLAFATLRDHHAAAFVASRGETPDARVLEADAAALKVLGSRHGVDALQACREACGGQGYLSVNRLADLRIDTDVFTTFEGDNTVLLQLVAKSVLAGYGKQFADGRALAVLRAVGRRVATTVLEKNPAQIRRTDPEHLRDRQFQLAALRYREAHLTETCAGRLRKRLAAKRDPEHAMLEVQEHLIAVAEAYAERLAFEWFAMQEATAPVAARPALHLLGDLHALVLLERRAAWFFEHDYFEDPKVRAIHRELEILLDEVAVIAPGVVSAFRIPDAVLAAPIAFFDPAHPRYDG